MTLWKHKASGRWCTKKMGRFHYFGTDKAVAEQRYQAWLDNRAWMDDGIDARNLSDFFNMWLTKSASHLPFDEWYAAYSLASRVVRKNGPLSAPLPVSNWNTLRESDWREWDCSDRVYAIKYGHVVKVGHSVNPRRRFTTLKVGSPCRLQFLFDVPGGYRHEQELHVLFRDESVSDKREFFNVTKRVQEWIEAVGSWKYLQEQ